MSYTKGGWTMQPLPHDFDFREGVVFVIRDMRNCALAEIGHIDAIFDGEETHANARLIAAAPDMYEALVDALGMMSSHSLGLFTEPGVTLQCKIEKALAKAEGAL